MGVLSFFHTFRNRKARKVSRKGMMRVAAYFTLVWLVCTFISLRHAKAEFADHTLDLGRQLSQLSSAGRQETTTIIFNGQKMLLGTALSDKTPKEVLDSYEAYCNDKGTPLFDKDPGQKEEDAPKTGFLRTEAGGEGSVICFAKGPATKPTRKESFETFVKTGNLGAIGELRYVYAKKGDTSNGKTVITTAWTDSSFNLIAIAPPNNDTDVAGEDHPNIPRPPMSVRTMSARAEGTAYGINIYRTSMAPEKLAELYDKEMLDKGWKMFDPERNDESIGKLGRGYVKDGVVLTINTLREQDGTYIGLGLAGVTATDKIGRIR